MLSRGRIFPFLMLVTGVLGTGLLLFRGQYLFALFFAAIDVFALATKIGNRNRARLQKQHEEQQPTQQE